jgi:hypothetical protein
MSPVIASRPRGTWDHYEIGIARTLALGDYQPATAG